MLETISDAILAELEEVMRRFVERVRVDPDTPSAHAVDENVLEDHLATFVADIASTIASVRLDDDRPREQLHDGTAIQRVVSQRHGAQRARMGWTERQVRREFVILEEELSSAIYRRLPTMGATPTPESATGEAGRAMIFLHQALEIAEGLSLESFRQNRVLAESERRSD
jgi:hypothetical protein